MVSKKKNPLFCEDGIEKSVTWDHHLFCNQSASCKITMGDLQEGFFYPKLTLLTFL